MKQDILNDKLQDHYRLKLAIELIQVLEATLGKQASAIVAYENDFCKARTKLREQEELLHQAMVLNRKTLPNYLVWSLTF